MKKTIFSLTILLAATAACWAGPESLPSDKEMKQVAPAPEPCMTWTGFYVGGQAGYGWGDGDAHFTPRPLGQFTAGGQTTEDLEPQGFVGGGQVGYNYQWHCLVFGAEADFIGSTMDDSNSDVKALVDEGRYSAHEDLDWSGTARLRVGFTPTCRLLLYSTGGLAYGHADYSANLDFRPFGGEHEYPALLSDTRVGWVAGGGAEYALTRHWSIRVEYLYRDLGDKTADAQGIPFNPPFNVHYNWDTTAQTVTTAINYRF